jgi:hypothetical protein
VGGEGLFKVGEE